MCRGVGCLTEDRLTKGRENTIGKKCELSHLSPISFTYSSRTL